MSGSAAATTELQCSGMLSKEQLIYLFNRFSFLTSQPDVKKRIAEAVKDKQEAVAVTTAIQEEILLEMGVDPSFGIACLGKVNLVYESDRDLMIKFYGFVANRTDTFAILRIKPPRVAVSYPVNSPDSTREEMACDEAELEPDELVEKMHIQHKLQEQQLEMLKHMRKFHPDDQSAILETLCQQMKNANFDNSSLVLTSEQIQEIVRRRISPFTSTR